MINAPTNAPAWAQDFARNIEDDLNSRAQAIPRVPFVNLADLIGGQLDPARFWSTKENMKFTALLGVQASGGPTICFSDGSDWIDLQTGLAVA